MRFMTSHPRLIILLALLCTHVFLMPDRCCAQAPAIPTVLNQPVDVSPDFSDAGNTIFVARKLDDFDANTGRGKLTWQRARISTDFAFNNMRTHLENVKGNEFPG